jgi:hypothetical protein
VATAAAVAAAVLLGTGLTAVRHAADGSGSSGGSASPRAGLLARPTGVVLLFADGQRLDPDSRGSSRRPIAGQRPGDQRWDIVRAGDAVVVGWGDVWATPVAGGPPRHLGSVVTFVPAAERGAVWLVDYPGGRIGEGTPTLTEVTVTGQVLRREAGPPPAAGVPTVGIPGGLAFETGDGVALWDASSGSFVRRLGEAAGFIGDAAAGELAWCEGMCATLHVTGVTGPNGPDRTFGVPGAGAVYLARTPRLSPDGRYVAVLTTHPGVMTAGQRGSLDVVDVQTGAVVTVRRAISVWSTFSWAATGDRLFFAAARAGGMRIGQFDARTDVTELAPAPVPGSAEPFVVLPRAAMSPRAR